MRTRYWYATVCIFLSLLANGSSAALQKVLVTCAPDTCEFHRVATFAIAGRQSVRVLTATGDTDAAPEIKGSRELGLEQIRTLYRDSKSGVFYVMEPDGKRRQPAVPTKSTFKSGDSMAAQWRTVALEYTAGTQAKTRTPVSQDSFAYLLVSADADVGVAQLLQRLVETPDFDSRRAALIRGAIQFAGNSGPIQHWRLNLVTRMQDGLKRFEEQTGDPTQLTAAIRDASSLRSIYMQIGSEGEQRDLL